MKLKIKTDSGVEEINDTDLADRVASGEKMSLPKGDYDVISPEGEHGKVPAKDLQNAMLNGYTFKDSGVKHEDEMKEKYGDQTVKGLLYGGARGLTLGASDLAMTATGFETPEALSEIKKRNPISSIGAEIVATAAPVFMTGGTSVLSKAASKTLPGLIASSSTRAGARAASNIASTVAKEALTMGVAGAAEGTAYGFGQTVSEAALGDAEFNAESLMKNMGTGLVFGGALGGVIGAGSGYLDKASKASKRVLRNKMVNQIDGDEAFKKEVISKIDNHDAMEEGLLALKDPEIQKIKELYPDAPTTPGMESALKPMKNVEAYLYDAPTLQGEGIRKSAKEVEAYVEKNVNEIFSGARDASAEETGDLIRQSFFTKINEPWQTGKAYYDDMMGEFGGFPVHQRHRTELSNIIKNSDAYRIGSEGADIKRVLGIIDDRAELLKKHADEFELLGLNKRQIKEITSDNGVSAKLNNELNAQGVNLNQFNATLARQAKELPKTNLTLRQIKNLQSDIAASAKVAKGAERQLLNEASDKLRGMQDSILREAAGGGKAGEKIVKGLDAANKDYVQAHKAKDKVAELFGVKGKSFDEVLEKLEAMSALDLEKKFLNIKKTDAAAKILEEMPEIGKLVLANRQSALLKKHVNQGTNVVNYSGIKKDLLKMSAEERAIYFGGSKAQEKKMLDMLTLFEKRPKTLNPSGTDVRAELRDLLSPKKQAQNWMLGEVYKGNDSFLGKMVNKVMPHLSGIETSANQTKNKISSSIGKFIKSTKAGVTAGSLEGLSEKKLKKAEKMYEEIQGNPEIILDSFKNKNASLLDAAPETYAMLQNKVIAGIQFLQSKSPRPDKDYLYSNRDPSRAEMMAFSDYVEAVEDPSVVYDQIGQGYINPRTVEVLKVVYPKIHQALIAEFIAKKPKVLSRTQMTEAQKLLGSRVMPAMDPDKFLILQRMTPESKKAGQQAVAELSPIAPVGGAKTMKASKRSQSDLDGTIYRS